MPQAGDVVYLTGCQCCAGSSSSSSSSGSCPACQNCVVTKFEGVTYDDPDYTGTYYAGLYLTFYPTNSGCTKYSMDYYFDSDLVLHMEVDTIAGTLIVWDYQPDRGLLNPMAVYGAATPGACPLGTYVFDHQGDGVLDATWPTTITLVNGSKTFGPDTLPQAVEISWPARCSYAPCTTSAVLSIVSSTYDVNGDVTAAQWSGGFCTTATGQVTHQAVMDMNCGIITLTITRLSDGAQISDGILASDPDSSWIDGEITMTDLGNIAFTCAITTVNFTIGHRNGETMTVDNCAACSTSSSSSSSSSVLSSSGSSNGSSSSSKSSSSSSSFYHACPCGTQRQYQFSLSGITRTVGGVPNDGIGCGTFNTTWTLSFRDEEPDGPGLTRCYWDVHNPGYILGGLDWTFVLNIHKSSPTVFFYSISLVSTTGASPDCVIWNGVSSDCTGATMNGGSQYPTGSCQCNCCNFTGFPPTGASTWPTTFTLAAI